MTPDDMEGRLEAFIRWLHPDNREPFSGSSLQVISDLRALLLDYQERGRALEPFADLADEFSVCGDGQPIGVKAVSGQSDLNVGHLRRAAEAFK